MKETIPKEARFLTIERDYLIFSLVIVLLLAIFCLVVGWQIHTTQERNRIEYFQTKAQTLEDKFSSSLDNVTNFIKYIGDKILLSGLQDEAKIEHLFLHDFSIDTNINDFYSSTLLNWINTDNKLIIDSQQGVLDTPEDVPPYYPLEKAKTEPWRLHIGEIQTVGTNYRVLPVALGIADENGLYVGAITSRILVETVNRDVKDVLSEDYIDYIILSQHLKEFFHTQKHLSDANLNAIAKHIANIAEPFLLLDTLNYDGTSYIIYQKSQYPFHILLGYKEDIVHQQFREALKPYIFIACLITFVFLIILYVFRKRFVLPIIEKLRGTLEEEKASRQEKERMLSQILEKVPGFIYRHKILDKRIFTEYVSEGCFDLTGYSQQEYTGNNPIHHSDVIDKEYHKDVIQKIESSLLTGQPFEVSYRITTASGDKKWVLNQGAPIKKASTGEGTIEGLLTDISEVKEAEQKLEKMVRELEISNAELERFAHVCSHDLKEPLRTIFSYIQLLKKDPINTLTHESEQYMEFIESGALQMKDLVEKILLYSKLGNQQIDFQPLNLNTIVLDAQQSLHAVIAEKNAEVKTRKLHTIYGDKEQLTRLFQNLISNALKFTHNKPQIEIWSEEFDQNSCKICIRDYGIGISRNFHTSIFNLFERLNSQDEYPGTGLGLAICQRIIERHNGKIWLESEEGVGTTFYFILPFHLDS